MSSKNRTFAEGLADAFETSSGEAIAPSGRRPISVLSSRSNRLAELAAGAVVTRTHELVDPARCRMWANHNREYGALTEERCEDLLESMKAQGKQEVPALVRRVRDDPAFDFEVICGARRHWSVSWLRSHNYPDFRFLVEVRDVTDEEAFRLADLENRARSDLTDLERARDYLRALDQYYEGHQASMANRINVTASWLSRYLDLARLPQEIHAAFNSAHDLRIKHVTLIKPLLKPDERKRRVIQEAKRIEEARVGGHATARSPADVIRMLAKAAEAPARSGHKRDATTPKKSGMMLEAILTVKGKPLLAVERQGRVTLGLTVSLRSGATREEIDAALAKALDSYWH